MEPTRVPGRGSRPTTEVARGLLDSLVALVLAEQQGIARSLAKEIQGLFIALERMNQLVEGPEVLTITHL